METENTFRYECCICNTEVIIDIELPENGLVCCDGDECQRMIQYRDFKPVRNEYEN